MTTVLSYLMVSGLLLLDAACLALGVLFIFSN